MLSREQFAEVEKVINAFVATRGPSEPLGWYTAASTLLHAIQSQLVVKVEVSPNATATGAIEGLEELGRRVGES